MKIKCDFCDGMYEDTEQFCPNCGAVNSQMKSEADLAANTGKIPQTIEELKAFCESKKLPLNDMRFFLGVDFKEPRAFGIFKDTDGNFVVYKNKADGTRAERYRGPDEAFAVKEIYDKMKSEVDLRRNKYGSSNKTGNTANLSTGGKTKKKGIWDKISTPVICGSIIALIVGISVHIVNKTPNRGYYKYNDTYYYCQSSNDWYYFDPLDAVWLFADSIDSELYDNYSNYYEDSYYSDGYGITDFSNTQYYSEPSNNDDNNDWDFGGDNWDAGDTDWDTDW